MHFHQSFRRLVDVVYEVYSLENFSERIWRDVGSFCESDVDHPSHIILTMATLRPLYIELADYEQGARLATTRISDVYRGRHKKTGQLVAIKHVFQISSPDKQRSFMREITIPQRLEMPGVVKCTGFSLQGNGGVIISELMQNGTLEQMNEKRFAGIATPGFGPTELSQAIFMTAVTMEQLHTRGVVHRDLKPENVFLDENMEARVGDFGLSRMFKPDITMTAGVGSPLFMAPELCDDSEEYDDSVDVFAFGVLIYTSFTPRMEFEGMIPCRTVYQVKNCIAAGKRLKRQPEIPEAFWQLIVQCWDQSPSKRPTFKGIVELMRGSALFAVPGTDIGKYLAYQASVLARFSRAAPAPDNNRKPNPGLNGNNNQRDERRQRSRPYDFIRRQRRANVVRV